ncbi:MAG: lysophospholipid acyltransferase family protein [Rhodospirillaceae bacterium]
MNDEPGWRQSRLKRAEVAAIAAVGYPLIALLARTLRLRIEGREHMEAVTAPGRPYIVSFWHGRILPLSLYFRGRGIVVITSENFDGEWIARIIGRLGYGTARGSSSRHARAATLQLVRDIRAGRPTAFTLDGPRGPARVAKPGAVWLAAATGAPLLPIHAECERSWSLHSWDRTQIPKPFTRVHMVVGPPIELPRGIGDEAQVEACRNLEAELERLRRRACELAKVEA